MNQLAVAKFARLISPNQGSSLLTGLKRLCDPKPHIAAPSSPPDREKPSIICALEDRLYLVEQPSLSKLQLGNRGHFKSLSPTCLTQTPNQPNQPNQPKKTGSLFTVFMLSITLLFIANPAAASNQSQAKQCAATPAQALAQIRGQNATSKNPALINPNTASLGELLSLPGVGQTKARAIIAYREQVGTFSSLDEITQVSGIGEKTYAQFKERLTLAP